MFSPKWERKRDSESNRNLFIILLEIFEGNLYRRITAHVEEIVATSAFCVGRFHFDEISPRIWKFV